MLQEFKSKEREMNLIVFQLAAWNKPPVVFTPNEHYFDQCFRDLVLQDSSVGPTDEGSVRILYYKVRAYLKVQTKFIVEAGMKQLMLLLIVGGTEIFRSHLFTCTSELLPFIMNSLTCKKKKLNA
jgi:hypothetical protein